MTSQVDSKHPKISCRYCNKDVRLEKLYHHISLYHFDSFWETKRPNLGTNKEALERALKKENYVPISICFKEERDGDHFFFNPSSLAIYRKHEMAKKASEKDKDNSLYKANAEKILNPHTQKEGVVVKEVIREVIKEVVKEVPVPVEGNPQASGVVVDALVSLVKKLQRALQASRTSCEEAESRFETLKEKATQRMFTEEAALKFIPYTPDEKIVNEKIVTLPELDRMRKALQQPFLTEEVVDAIEWIGDAPDVDLKEFYTRETRSEYNLIKNLFVEKKPKPEPEPEKPAPVVAPEPVPEPPKPAPVEKPQEAPLAPKPVKKMKVAQKATSAVVPLAVATAAQSDAHPSNPQPSSQPVSHPPAQKFSLQQMANFQYHTPAPSFPPLVLRTTR